ncbi:hypothetical protein Hanom_Chr08g00696371 [Helianthus anomalus]
MVGFGLGIRLGHWLTREMGASPSLKSTLMGYGGAWIGGHEFGLAIKSPPCHLTSPTSPPHARLQTHANGATPQPKPHTPQPKAEFEVLKSPQPQKVGRGVSARSSQPPE